MNRGQHWSFRPKSAFMPLSGGGIGLFLYLAAFATGSGIGLVFGLRDYWPFLPAAVSMGFVAYRVATVRLGFNGRELLIRNRLRSSVVPINAVRRVEHSHLDRSHISHGVLRICFEHGGDVRRLQLDATALDDPSERQEVLEKLRSIFPDAGFGYLTG